jgi:uncharacterized protein (TIGR03435 family)
MWLAVQSLLEDRFQLRTHYEMRELPVYNLVVGKNGAKIKLSEDQTPTNPADQRGTPFNPSARPPRGTMRVTGMPSPSTQTILLTISATALPLSQFINVLQDYAGRPVVDKSGITGLFDLRLQFALETPSILSSAAPPTGGQVAPALASDPPGPSLFTAIQEQLGLKLDSAREPVQVLVIDNVQKPSEN